MPGHAGCYRYNPLFRDLLRAILAYESPDEMKRLQRTAAEWYSRDGQVTEHALEDMRAQGWRVQPVCPFTVGYLNAHPEYADLLV